MDSPTTLNPPGRRAWLSAIAVAVAFATFALALAPASVGAQTAQADIPAGLAQAVRAQVAAQTGVSADQVSLPRAERVIWENGCLGIQPATGEVCAQGQVSGYVVWGMGNNVTARYHTNFSGTDVRVGQAAVANATADPLPAGATLVQSNADALPEAVTTEVTSLAATRAGLTTTDVTILRVEAVSFQDSCLGLGQANESCAQVITDGYVVWVRAGTNIYRYHTAEEATNIRFGEAGLDEGNVPLLSLPTGASARDDDGTDPGPTDGLLTGEVPTSGFALLQVTAEATPAQLLVALVGQGCAPVSFAVTQGGSFITYIPGAPAFVNAAFPTSMDAGTGFAVRCA